jgi:hypothetical protein
MKGGEDYVFPLGTNSRSEEALAELVNYFRKDVEWSNEGSRSYIVGYGVVADEFLTEFEQSQLDYEGSIRYPATVLKLVEEMV